MPIPSELHTTSYPRQERAHLEDTVCMPHAARSIALARLERAVDELVDESRALSTQLVRRGRPVGEASPIVRRLGHLNLLRLELASWTDKAAPPASGSTSTRHARGEAAIRARQAVLSAKLDALESLTRTDLEAWHGRRSNGLEWTIVLLIVADIALALL